MFHVLLLKKDIIKKNQIDKNIPRFDFGNNKEYKVRKILNSMIYIIELAVKSLSRLYYIITWIGYS